MLIAESLSPESVVLCETAGSTIEVVKKLAAKLAGQLGQDRQTIEEAVIARERARTTAFTNGAAIPHCRLAELHRFGIAMMILKKPVRWDNQGHAVDIVMMIAGPSQHIPEQLRILANSGQVLDSPAVRTKLKRAPDAKAVCELMAAAEKAVEARRARDGVLRELRRDQADSADYLAEVADTFQW
ncbi:MAG TPA: PTS sugar transporter subunit IIA [Phycisphaerae bacterium]|nr:PTS sugar transporter subunit IIA [Phycisphaerae bacterium]HRR83748.1 PTS sugar transporter subunit IIA [Phycisphaerae bacterium]